LCIEFFSFPSAGNFDTCHDRAMQLTEGTRKAAGPFFPESIEVAVAPKQKSDAGTMP
jgi:hypothetical protein